MPYDVLDKEEDRDHQWAVVRCSCDLENGDDPLVQHTVEFIREAYGEKRLRARLEANAAALEPDPLVIKKFKVDSVLRAFRMGLPDPEKEANKPPQLTNYRSETTEFVARAALQAAYGISFPTHPQRGKTNQDQPVLGFDGWGIAESPDDRYSLVLIQVKGTESKSCPPPESAVLAEECKQVLQKLGTICRALSVMVLDLEVSSLSDALINLMEHIGEGGTPVVLVAPVVVRGTSEACQGDFGPIREACHGLDPSVGWGVVVTVGAPLNDFGKTVMTRARAA